jgi:hypothetical protein
LNANGRLKPGPKLLRIGCKAIPLQDFKLQPERTGWSS